MMLDKKQIQVIFLFEFKMGRKAAETTRNINNTFGPRTANEHTVQWWRICLSMQADWVGFDPQPRKIPRAAECYARAPQLLGLCSGVQELQLLSLHPGTCVPIQERLPQWEACSQQLGISLCSNNDPTQPKIKKKKNYLKKP